jgi:hypothetical protein
VHEVTQPTRRPPAAVAAPFAEMPAATTTTSLRGNSSAKNADGTVPDVGGVRGGIDAPTTSTTESTLPRTATHPFERGAEGAGTPTTAAPPPASPPTTEAPAPAGGAVHGTLSGESFDVTGQRPDFSVRGRSVLHSDKGDDVRGLLEGELYIADRVGDEGSAELVFTLDDGRQRRIRFRGSVDREDVGGNTTTWTLNGAYSIPGGDAFGLADMGTASVVFRDVDGAPSALSFDLDGQSSSD